MVDGDGPVHRYIKDCTYFMDLDRWVRTDVDLKRTESSKSQFYKVHEIVVPSVDSSCIFKKQSFEDDTD